MIELTRGQRAPHITMNPVSNPLVAAYLSTPLTAYSSKTAPKIEAFLELLNTSGDVEIGKVRKLAFNGVPEECKGLRALVWRLLFSYLPPQSADWPALLRMQRSNYSDFRRDLLQMAPPTQGPGDHPLNSAPDSHWKQYFADQLVWEDIEKDIKRTRPDMSFFFQPSDATITIEDVVAGRKPETPFKRPFNSVFSEYYSDVRPSNDYTQLILNNESIEKHADVMARILFIYAKLNPGVKYIQGMNEILAPIYFAFSQDSNEDFCLNAEADAFYCFTSLMSEIRDSFVRSLDMDNLGLQGKMNRINSLLSRLSPDVYAHLETLKVQPYYYAMKWVMLLFTQDFELPDILRLWDSFLADENRFDFFYYACIAMVELNREAVLKGDFGEVLSVLQHPVNFDANELLACAVRIMESDEGREYSQDA